MLPLDVMVVPQPPLSVSAATKAMKQVGRQWDGYSIPFPFREASITSGGKVANVAAFLATDGWRVGVVGGVGDDDIGQRVLADLEGHGVITDDVVRVAGAATRIMGIVRSGSRETSSRFSLNGRDLRFVASWAEGAGACGTLVLGRSNRTSIRLARAARERGSRVVLGVPSASWRANVLVNQCELLGHVDLAFAFEKDWRTLCSRPEAELRDVLVDALALAHRASLVVAYDREANRLTAMLRGTSRTIRAKAPELPLGKDSTGVTDCALGALLSALSRWTWAEDRYVVRAALGYAQECASFVRLGLGARFFPAPGARADALARHRASMPTRARCFISYGHCDRTFAAWLRGRLDELPGVSVWIDDENLDHGTRLRAKVKDAIHSCDVFLVVCSRAGLEREWVRWESGLAGRRAATGEMDFIPIVLEGDPAPSRNPLMKDLAPQLDLANILAADFTDASDRQRSLEKLGRSLHALGSGRTGR